MNLLLCYLNYFLDKIGQRSDSPDAKFIIPWWHHGGDPKPSESLARAFMAHGHEVVVISRKVEAAWQMVAWDAKTLGPWASEFEGGADMVINLAGRSVNCRYTPKNRRTIIDSRSSTPRCVVGEAIARFFRPNPPPLWLQASSATVYSHRYDAPNDDDTGILAGNEPNQPETWLFSLDVGRQWEKAIDDAAHAGHAQSEAPHVHRSQPRSRRQRLKSSSISCGAALAGAPVMARQFVSWIHDQDFIRAIRFIIDHESINGPVIIASPNPLPNAEFMRGSARSVGHFVRSARERLDSGTGRVFHAHRNRVDFEKPPRCPQPPVARRFHIPIPSEARSRPRPLRPVAGHAVNRGVSQGNVCQRNGERPSS